MKNFTMYLGKLLVVFVCLASTAYATLPSVSGKFQAPDKYGNILTDIPVNALTEAGYELGDVISYAIDGGESHTAPFVIHYSDVDRGNPLIRESKGVIMLSINYGDFAKTYGAIENGTVTLALDSKAAYKMEFEIRHLEKSEDRNDYASDQIFSNFRNVTYGNMVPKILYRSSHPANEEARAEYTIKDVENAQIKTVINLSDSEEELLVNAERFSHYGELNRLGVIIALDMGVDFTSDTFSAKTRDGLRFLTANEPPYLIHCREGKDRTGMIIALLEALMGATVDEIVEDYMMTYENYYGITKGSVQYEYISKTIYGILLDINNGKQVNDENLKEAAENYLINTIGLSTDEINSLKVRLKG